MGNQSTFPIFSMINDFESKSFHIPEIKAQHRSLYYFLLGVLMHRRGLNRFEMAYDYGMSGAKIGNHKTYTSTLLDLQTHGFLKYTPGKNRFTSPVIDMQFCKPTANLLQAYCISIGVSTANNIKDKDTKEDKDIKPSLLHKNAKEIFENFYSSKFKTNYIFTGAKDATNLKSLLTKIATKVKESEMEVTEENQLNGFKHYLESITDRWVLDNLSISLVNSKFNELFKSAKNGTAKTNHYGNPLEIFKQYGA